MTVKEKIAEKKKKLAERKVPVKSVSVQAGTYQVICINCKKGFISVNELDLDGEGRCLPCQEIRDAELEEIMKRNPRMLASQQEDARPSYFETLGIEYNGIKFIPLK